VVIFGGGFDPPHAWHTRIAAAVRRRVFGTSGWVVFIPAARSPLKNSGPIASGADRVEMLKRATAGMKRVEIWTVELDQATDGPAAIKPSPSYTIDTLKRARATLPREVPMRLLIGTDQAAQFHLWKQPREVIRLAEPVVVRRPPFLSDTKLRAALSASGAWSKPEIDAWMSRLIDAPTRDLSSTQIRRLLSSPRMRDRAQRTTLRHVVRPSVLAYIRRRGLYAPTSRPS
jgi:nicotinate-nucleotide adenylyltransferase